MFWRPAVEIVVGFLTSCLIGSFAEYFVHVLMHRRLLQGKLHTFHHKDGTGQGVWGEFWQYVIPASPVPVIVSVAAYFLGFPWAGVGVVVGFFVICLVCAYCHQASHERPELLFWMKFPPHYIHHRDNLWWYNYGVSSTVWDRLFRTYKDVDYTPRLRLRQLRPRDFFDLKWRISDVPARFPDELAPVPAEHAEPAATPPAR